MIVEIEIVAKWLEDVRRDGREDIREHGMEEGRWIGSGWNWLEEVPRGKRRGGDARSSVKRWRAQLGWKYLGAPAPLKQVPRIQLQRRKSLSTVDQASRDKGLLGELLGGDLVGGADG